MTESMAVSRWTQETEEKLIALWQEHLCLYDISSDHYHNRLEKEKVWKEIANSLQLPVQEVKTRAISLRTQYSRMIKPKPSRNGSKPLTHRQRWLLRVMAFIKKHIVHRTSETTLDVSFSEQGEAEDLFGSSELSSTQHETSSISPTPSRQPSDSPLRSTSPFEPSDEAAPAPPKRKRNRRSENDVELQTFVILKQMAATIEADPADVFTTFGNQVASELRLIQDQASLTRLKRTIMNMIYNTQDAERNRTVPLHIYHPHHTHIKLEPEEPEFPSLVSLT